MLFDFGRQPAQADVAQLAEGHIHRGQKRKYQKQDEANG
jgi:hypothetical protein